MSSDIPGARTILGEALQELDAGRFSAVKELIELALSGMTREPLARPRAPRQVVTITPAQRELIYRLADTTELTQAEIAMRVGLEAKDLGRVSEVLAGKR